MLNEDEKTALQGVEDEANFIAAMKRIREEHGWSQGELARRMTDAGWEGFHQTTISRIEKGERPVRLAEAQGLAQVLGALLGQMILPSDQSKSLRDLELSVQRLNQAAHAITGAVQEFQAESAVVRYQLMELEGVALDSTMDSSVAARLEIVMQRARQLVAEGVNSHIAAGMET